MAEDDSLRRELFLLPGAGSVSPADYIVISFLPLILKNRAKAITVEKVRMAEMAEATPSLPRMT